MSYKKSRHLENVKYEIRGRVATRAKQLRMQGVNILELNLGNPGLFNFQTPDTMNMALIRNLDKATGYSDAKGIFSAREAVVMETQSQGIKGLDVDDVFMGNGVSELIMMAVEALLNPGDEVLIPSPDYPLWTAAVRLTGGNAVYYNCDAVNEWQPDIEHLQSQISPNTKAITLINPNNPTGAVYSKEALLEIIEIARKNQLIIFSDEIYSKILYDGNVFHPLSTLADDVLVLTFNGLSKNYRACGYRVGWMYITGPLDNAADYIDGLTLLANMRLCANVPGQWTTQTALGGYQSIYDLTSGDGRLNKQKKLTIERLSALEGISCVAPKGALYAFPEADFSMYNFDSDEELVLKFLEEKHVLLVQGSGFNYYRSPAFRVVFLPHSDTLNNAFDRLQDFLKSHKR